MDNLFLFEYNIESLSRAIYCITSWFPNRRFLGIVDQLNRDFISNETKILGTEKIDTYIKFIEFYTKVIETYIPEFPPEDFPIDIEMLDSIRIIDFIKYLLGMEVRTLTKQHLL